MGSGHAVYCKEDQMSFPPGSSMDFATIFKGGTAASDPTLVRNTLGGWKTLIGFDGKDWDKDKKAKGKLTIKNSNESETLKKAVLHFKAGTDATSKVEVDTEYQDSTTKFCDTTKKSCHITITCPNKKTAYPDG